MSEYGWQVFDANENLLYDDSVIMSKWLGSYTVPMMSCGGADWSQRISGIAFRDGTPFAYCVPTPGLIVPADRTFAYSPPNIYCGADYIDISYNSRILSFPDDTAYSLAFGGVTVHWGVYNG
ncbi:hypothetical protein [Mixta mediterraneensis]|uniref:hypothetical protein n=1 Tax=Mixta mediterraneensis TaxID=2758443 RepID=UPI001875BCB9|nr:hypothetical protein [Mixta mediterraneensis]MBE5251716.1 hypothetical protein [Mixta mediterraneensis]